MIAVVCTVFESGDLVFSIVAVRKKRNPSPLPLVVRIECSSHVVQLTTRTMSSIVRSGR